MSFCWYFGWRYFWWKKIECVVWSEYVLPEKSVVITRLTNISKIFYVKNKIQSPSWRRRPNFQNNLSLWRCRDVLSKLDLLHLRTKNTLRFFVLVACQNQIQKQIPKLQIQKLSYFKIIKFHAYVCQQNCHWSHYLPTYLPIHPSVTFSSLSHLSNSTSWSKIIEILNLNASIFLIAVFIEAYFSAVSKY